jgi:hypothetical protein
MQPASGAHHGWYMQERLMEASDAFRVHVDTTSGLLASANLKNQTFTSLTGNKTAEIVQVGQPLSLNASRIS